MARLKGLGGFLACMTGLVLCGCGGSPTDGGSERAVAHLVSARSLSKHYVEVMFDAPVDSVLGSAAVYSISADDGAVELAVREAKLSEDNLRAILTTDIQSERPYTLRLDPSAPVVPQQPGDVVAANFPGTSTNEFTLGYAVALTNTSVLLMFSDPPTTGTAPILSNYSINDPDLAIRSAVRGAGTNVHTIVLTTSPQTDELYTVKVVNLSNSYSLIDPERNTATFYGINPVDTTAPKLISAEATDVDKILLSFSEPVENFAADVASYSVNNSLTVLGAEPNEWGTQVLLSVQDMTVDTNYTVTVMRVEDRNGNVIDPAFRTASFEFTGEPSAPPVDESPRVVGAISTSDTSVLVLFSEPMGPSADDATNYQISGPDTTWLQVLGAARRDDDWSAVDLTTSGQTDLLYTVHVGAVKDLAGNPIAAPDDILSPPDGVDPSAAKFYGTPNKDDWDEQVDRDGDTFADWFETAGWVVKVQLANGDFVTKIVTSDPEKADTDGDGFTDGQENQHGWDPRTSDTDADWVDDWSEFNIWYTDPADQDSDDDGIDDFTEIDFFHTAPHLEDTDGDGLSDGEELFDRSRHPRIADLPIPQITVDEIALELNITSSYTDEEGQTQSRSDTTSATFTDSRTTSLGTSSTNSTESENTFGQKIGAEGGTAGFKISGEISFGQSQAQGYSTTVDSETSQTSQQEYQESVTTGLEFSESRSVTRNIDSAIVQATVNIANKSDIAFSITNIELSMLQQDRVTGLTFRPIATLRPTAASDPTGQPVYNILPLEAGRGPIIFENSSVFPNRVDALMREPTGLVVKVVNFDVFDEFERNLVFTTQEVMDKTVAITIDFGDGRVELYRIATTANGFDEDSGLPVGLTLGQMMASDPEGAMEIAGLTHDTVASTDPNTYATIIDTRTLQGGGTVDVEALVRVRDVANSADGKKFWTAVSSNTDLDENSDFRSLPLSAHETLLIMYTSDEDEDDLFLREEYLYGSSDTDTDSDDDTLNDFFEVRTGWTVAKVPGLPYKTFPSPARGDSDLDGLEDDEEFAAKTDPNRSDTDEDGRSDPSELLDTYTYSLFDGDNDITNDVPLTVAPYSDWAIVTGPDNACDTTTPGGDDAVATYASNFAGRICIHPGADGVINTAVVDDDVLVATPKIDAASNGACDTLTATGDDVIEYVLDVGSGDYIPRDRGAMGPVCVSAGANGVIDTDVVADDFLRVAHTGLFGTDPVKHDTDTDGINDGREVILGINPNSKDAGRVVDTDSDGLFDDEEDFGWLLAGTTTRVYSDKNISDTDRDGIPDVLERAIGSDPNDSDTDNDTLLDYVEFDSANPLSNNVPLYDAVTLAAAFTRCADAAPSCSYVAPHPSLIIGTHPSKADTDGDTRNDNVEVNIGWNVTVFGGTPVAVKSDPLNADVDGDGLNDASELTQLTDPEDPDTDGDGRDDEAEVTATLDPLRPDKRISVTLVDIDVVDDCDDTSLEGLEIKGNFTIEKPDGTTFTFKTYGCSSEQGACGIASCCLSEGDSQACPGETYTVGVGSGNFIIKSSESFTLETDSLTDIDSLDCTTQFGNTIGTMSEVVNFSSIPSAKNVTVGSSGCQIVVNYTITTVN